MITSLIRNPFSVFGLSRDCSPRDFFGDLEQLFDDSAGFCGVRSSFNVDLQEDDNYYYLRADAPGVVAEDLDIQWDEKSSRLTVGVVHKEEKNEGNSVYRIRERQFARNSRSFLMPFADSDKIEAKLTNGVLDVKVGKNRESKEKSRKIKISA